MLSLAKLFLSVKINEKIRIAAAENAAKKEIAPTSKSCRILSTECIWSMLDLKYVFPTYSCVHVNTLLFGNRSCVKRRQKYNRFVDKSGQNHQHYNFIRFEKIYIYRETGCLVKTRKNSAEIFLFGSNNRHSVIIWA